jgi:hypothetical protein
VNLAPLVTDLDTLEAAVDRALATGDESGIRVLGYGEISCVVAWQADGVPVACKRLPLFSTEGQLDRYRATLDAYVAALDTAGVSVVPTRLQSVRRDDGRFAAYCVQPALLPEALGPRFVSTATREGALTVFDAIIDRLSGSVSARLGVDGQLSNWAVVDGQLHYLDVTTPLMRDGDGRDQLDPEVFLASLPWALRGIVRRFVLTSIADKYFDRRGTLLDLLGNLHKEGLEGFLPALLDRTRPHVDRPITATEVSAYYASDARTWAALQRLRRIDRAWQTRVRRRVYPFLLPGRIER